MIKKLFIVLLLIGIVTVIINETVSANENLATIVTIGDREEGNDFSYYSLGDGTHRMYTSQYIPIPDDATYFELYLPNIKYLVYDDFDPYSDSAIFLYNSNYSTDGFAYIADLTDAQGIGRYIIDTEDLDYQSSNYFQVYIQVDYDNHANPNFLKWFNERWNYTFDGVVELSGNTDVKYYIGDELYYHSTYLDIPDKPFNPFTKNSTLVFNKWITPTGEVYNFDVPIYPETYNQSDLILTATFRFISTGAIETPNDIPTTISNIMTLYGLNNLVGKILIFVIFVVVATGGLLLAKLPAFIVVIVDIFIMALFIFLGFLPIWFIIIISIALIVALLSTLKEVN